ncbi:MAG TPA: ABC transporter ATP-binding protein [Planctomycetota bacterium]|nr:ABC transporter ATP-binding protein [Planctomycetota bacterium]
MKTIRFVYPYLKPHWRGYALGLLLVPLSIAASLSTPYLTGEAVATLQSPGGRTEDLYPTLAWILILSVVGGLSLFAVRYLLIGASRKMEFDLRNHVFRHLQSLDQIYFKNARTGDIMARITADVEGVRTLAGPVIMYTARTIILLAVAIPLMASVSWLLTLCIMAPLSLLTLSVRKVGPRVHKAVARAQDVLSELSSSAQENFAGVRVVKSYAQEGAEIRTFGSVARRYLDRNLDVARISALMQPIIGGVGDVSLISLLFVGGMLLLQDKLELSDLIKFAGYQGSLLWPMISIGWVANQFHRGTASIERIQAILSVEPRVKESASPLLPESGAIEGSVSIRGLTFAYAPGPKPVLKDVSLEAPRGSTVAIVGRTGAGKSTLVSLIARIYPVPDGAVFVDEIDVNRLPLSVLRRSIGFVPQESFLFSRTVSENIAFGAEEWDLEEIYGVAEVTRFEKDIDQLPRGYDELVGERGVTLSGGQKQRAAMARALFVKPKILILDDALSAVDSQTESEIVENLKRATRGLTTIVVSHRLSSIRHADRIYVLDGGRVAEEGTHAELLERHGLYSDMYRLQLISDELERM